MQNKGIYGGNMSRVHLGMKRPIRQFEKSYTQLLELIKQIESEPPQDKFDKDMYIYKLKETFNDTIIQLNNIKDTQLEYLEREEIK